MTLASCFSNKASRIHRYLGLYEVAIFLVWFLLLSNDFLFIRLEEECIVIISELTNWIMQIYNYQKYVGWLIVFNVLSTTRSFRDGAPIYYPLWRTWSSVSTPSPLGIEPCVVVWQSSTQPLSQLHTKICVNPLVLKNVWHSNVSVFACLE